MYLHVWEKHSHACVLCTHAHVEYAMASGVLAVRKSLVEIEEVVQLLTSAPDSQVESD